MKKDSLKALVKHLNGEAVENLDEIKAEIESELAKGEAKATANRALYEQAKDTVLEELAKATTHIPVSELYKAVEGKVPATFTQAKLSYALTHYWADCVDKVFDGEVNTYMVRG